MQALQFPLDVNTLFALKNGGFILSGVATVSGGEAIIGDRRIKPSAVPLITSKGSTSGRAYAADCANGSLTILGDDGDVYYLIIL